MAYDPANGRPAGPVRRWLRRHRLQRHWTWNGATWAQLLQAASPSARYALTMAYDVATNQMFLSAV